MIVLPLQTIRVALASIMLIYGAYRDVREREVSDILWFIFIPTGAILLAYESLSEMQFPYLSVISIALTATLAFSLYKMHLYGGADAFGLATLSVVIPIYEPPIYIHEIAALMAFTNATFFTLASPIYMMLRNLVSILRGRKVFSGFEHEPLWKKIVACFLGYRAAKSSNFLFSLEKTNNGEKQFDFKLVSPNDDFVFVEDSWVTPGLPLLLFIAIGYFFMLLYGDIIAFIFRALRII